MDTETAKRLLLLGTYINGLLEWEYEDMDRQLILEATVEDLNSIVGGKEPTAVKNLYDNS